MIKIDKNKYEIEGKGDEILAELTIVLANVTKDLSKQSGESEDEILADITTKLLIGTKFVLHKNKEDK